MIKTRGWYWKVHGDEYTKSSMGDIEKFMGWDTLMNLVRECENTPYKVSPVWPTDHPGVKEYREHLIRRDQALIAALFLTGGRVNEVVPLRKANFETHPRSIHVKGMTVLKRYRKTDSYIDSEGKKRYITEPIQVTRGVFAIQPKEPLVPVLTSWLAETEDHLFPSPAKNRSHISDNWAYQIVRNVGERIGVNVWPHWFRSQRASQLVMDYRFPIHELADWFKWAKLDTARIYTRLDPSAYENLYDKAEEKKTLQEQLNKVQEQLDRVQMENEQLRAAAALQEAPGW